MNERIAKMVARMVGGKVVDSGGGVLTVEVKNEKLGVTLCLGNGGWFIEDEDGEHTVDSYDVD